MLDDERDGARHARLVADDARAGGRLHRDADRAFVAVARTNPREDRVEPRHRPGSARPIARLADDREIARDRDQLRHRRGDAPQHLAVLLGGALAAERDLDLARQRRERRADLVRHGRGEAPQIAVQRVPRAHVVRRPAAIE